MVEKTCREEGRRDETLAQLLTGFSFVSFLCFQGHQEHRGEAAGPFEKNRLQHPGFEGPDQHPERVCRVMAAGIKENKKKKKGRYSSSGTEAGRPLWTLKWAGAQAAQTDPDGHQGPGEPGRSVGADQRLAVHLWFLHSYPHSWKSSKYTTRLRRLDCVFRLLLFLVTHLSFFLYRCNTLLHLLLPFLKESHSLLFQFVEEINPPPTPRPPPSPKNQWLSQRHPGI